MDDEQSNILIVHESLGIVIAMNEEKTTIITQASKIADKICVPFVRIRSCGLSMSD